ncbi:MAG: hypothetical protein HYV07_17105 [Deltaproteobacteria bacterium]|nr:hypothetical protein [Deltaproteobacteria bacterium]
MSRCEQNEPAGRSDSARRRAAKSRHGGVGAAALVALFELCACGESIVWIPDAELGDLVVGVFSVDGAVSGAFAVRAGEAVTRLPAPEGGVLVAFVLGRDELVGPDGDALPDDFVPAVSIGGADVGCGRCLLDAPRPPMFVFPGDECAPPAFSRTFIPGAVYSPEVAQSVRKRMRLHWPGRCPCPLGPILESEPREWKLESTGTGDTSLYSWVVPTSTRSVMMISATGGLISEVGSAGRPVSASWGVPLSFFRAGDDTVLISLEPTTRAGPETQEVVVHRMDPSLNSVARLATGLFHLEFAVPFEDGLFVLSGDARPPGATRKPTLLTCRAGEPIRCDPILATHQVNARDFEGVARGSDGFVAQYVPSAGGLGSVRWSKLPGPEVREVVADGSRGHLVLENGELVEYWISDSEPLSVGSSVLGLPRTAAVTVGDREFVCAQLAGARVLVSLDAHVSNPRFHACACRFALRTRGGATALVSQGWLELGPDLAEIESCPVSVGAVVSLGLANGLEELEGDARSWAAIDGQGDVFVGAPGGPLAPVLAAETRPFRHALAARRDAFYSFQTDRVVVTDGELEGVRPLDRTLPGPPSNAIWSPESDLFLLSGSSVDTGSWLATLDGDTLAVRELTATSDGLHGAVWMREGFLVAQKESLHVLRSGDLSAPIPIDWDDPNTPEIEQAPSSRCGAGGWLRELANGGGTPWLVGCGETLLHVIGAGANARAVRVATKGILQDSISGSSRSIDALDGACVDRAVFAYGFPDRHEARLFEVVPGSREEVELPVAPANLPARPIGVNELRLAGGSIFVTHSDGRWSYVDRHESSRTRRQLVGDAIVSFAANDVGEIAVGTQHRRLLVSRTR